MIEPRIETPEEMNRDYLRRIRRAALDLARMTYNTEARDSIEDQAMFLRHLVEGRKRVMETIRPPRREFYEDLGKKGEQ